MFCKELCQEKSASKICFPVHADARKWYNRNFMGSRGNLAHGRVIMVQSVVENATVWFPFRAGVVETCNSMTISERTCCIETNAGICTPRMQKRARIEKAAAVIHNTKVTLLTSTLYSQNKIRKKSIE